MNIIYLLSGGGGLSAPLCPRRDELDSVHRGSGSRCGGERRCWLGAASGYFAPTSLNLKCANLLPEFVLFFRSIAKEERKNQEI